jgi:hypothetical protein
MRALKSFLDGGLLRQARLLEAMTGSLRLQLSGEVARHCWVGGIRDRMLTVVTDTASFATLVHYQQHEILKRINSDFRLELPAPLTRLKARVAKLAPETRVPLERPRLSADNARSLASAAKHIDNPELKSALAKLAQRGKR